MDTTQRKSFLLHSLKIGLFSLIFSCIGVLLLALFAKLFNIPNNVLPIVNQVLKAIAVAVSVLLFAKEEKFLLKSLVGAGLFWVLSFTLFGVLGGGFHWAQILLDLAVALAISVIVALIKAKRAR